MSVLLFRWGSYCWACNLLVLSIYLFFLPVMLPSASKARHRLSRESVSWCLETSLLKIPFPGQDSLPRTELTPYLLCLFFHLLYFFLTGFKDNDLLFWVPDVLCQHSEVVLWSLLSIQMFFWLICGGESGLPILFLHHLRTAHCPLFDWIGFVLFFFSGIELHKLLVYFGD